MSESAILSNQREAVRLYQRGVAAARGGQRRVAVGLLQRAVQLDPQHEGAWLWLSGVLDDPDDVAYCLRTVLAINPANERASAGLAWLEQRHKASQNGAALAMASATVTATTARLPVIVRPAEDEEPAAAREARHHGESWWVNWRRSRRAMSRARIILWLVPILLLSLTLAWRYSVEMTVLRIQSNLRPTAAPTVAPIVVSAVLEATPAPLPPTRPQASDDALILAYLSQLEPLRVQLRQAVEDYRTAIKRPGGSSIQHSAAARQLRSKVKNARDTMAAMTAPRPIKDLHAEYLTGLETELQALDSLLAFYSEYSAGLANRAALGFQESNTRFGLAQAGFDSHLSRIERLAVGPSLYALR